MPIPIHLVIVTLIIGSTLELFAVGYKMILPIIIDIIDNDLNIDTLRTIKRWNVRVFQIKLQLINSIIWVIIACAVVGYLSVNKSSIPIYLSSYVAVALAAFILGNGIYVSFIFPTLIQAVSKSKFDLYVFSPSDSPIIRKLKRAFGGMSLIYSLVFSLILLELYQIVPINSLAEYQWAFVLLLLGLVIISYSFLYPHYFLTNIIRREKIAALDDLQKKINLIYRSKDNPDSQFIDSIKNLTEVYKLIRSSSDSSISVLGWGNYLTSLILPTLSFLSGLLDIRKLWIP